MPGHTMKVSTAKKQRKGGIRQIRYKNKTMYEIRTESGNWKKVPKNANVWHRGRGSWSHNTKKIDKQLPGAGSQEFKKRGGHTGDKKYSTHKKGAKYGRAKRYGTKKRRWKLF